jgi:probable F420-dependent oxidoreductase
MDVGIVTFPTSYTLPPDRLGRAVEEAGFESLFVSEHSHIPASRESAWAGGAELPSYYWEAYDPFVALTAAAVTTERIRLGTGVCLVVERDPIMTAKEVASLDVLSGGRVEFGVGAGWNLEEMANHGTDPARRFSLMRERVEAMQAIWTSEEAEYHGEQVDFDPIWLAPKPVQKPYPPILVGGGGPKVIDRVLRYGDGWFPIRPESPADLAGRVEELQTRAADAGCGPIPVTLFGAKPKAAALEEWAAAGVTRALIMLPSVEPDEGLRLIEKYGGAAAEFRGS